MDDAFEGAPGTMAAGIDPFKPLKKKIKKLKKAIAIMSLIIIVSTVIGILLLVYFFKDWNTGKRWISIVGFVFIGIALLLIIALSIAFYVIIRIYRNMSGQQHRYDPGNLAEADYPRQPANYE